MTRMVDASESDASTMPSKAVPQLQAQDEALNTEVCIATLPPTPWTDCDQGEPAADEGDKDSLARTFNAPPIAKLHKKEKEKGFDATV